MICKNKPKISIIIPLYNAADSIDRCMESIRSQTFDDYEVILVNDGSTDGSAEICRRYSDSDGQVIFVDKENGGAGSARNAGIGVSNGEYIYFCDADDETNCDLLNRVYSAAESNNADLTVFSINRKTIDSNTGEVISEKCTPARDAVFTNKSLFRNSFSKLYYDGVLFGGPVNKLFKSSIIKKNNIRFPDLRRGQDEIFNFLYYPYVNKCVIIPDVLYTYFSYDKKAKNIKYRLDYFKTTTKTYLKTFESLMDDFGLTDEYTVSKFQNSFVYFMENSVLLAFNPIEKLSKNQKIQFIEKVMKDEYVLSQINKIDYVPESHAEFWRLFSIGDPYCMYRFLKRGLTVSKIKEIIKKATKLRSAKTV